MVKIKVAIYDADKGYRERFADYLMNHKASEMELGEPTPFACDQLEIFGCHIEIFADRVAVRYALHILHLARYPLTPRGFKHPAFASVGEDEGVFVISCP